MSTEELTGHYIRIDGTRTFYDEIGTGIPFIGIHTAGSDSREYQYLLPLLAARGFRAVALDLPGHSRSYPQNWRATTSLHEHAEFVFRFAREVFGDEKPVVAGCSIGGCISFDLIAHHSDAFRAIIPMEGLAWGSRILPAPVDLARPSWSTAWKPFLEYAAVDSLGKPTLARAEKVKELWWQHQNAHEAGNGDIQGWAAHDVRHLLGDSQCPVLVVKGNDDFWLPAELIEQSAAMVGDQAEIAMLDGIGHYPMFEDPELIADLIADFVKRRVVE
ncbi:alpha/beta hydrolase [Nocardioides immobilis]|uniref:Alpha/beta hydrolase n=1 Tax=Nocardioides immobilis TaxID=2049295 RepID=A0A417Y771_9ACTN|nr:alpha/beta hydrolase [Nocardioides immobilis]RHW28417.1 alpha/beta hydrolase [Nocardioides immobilis]